MIAIHAKSYITDIMYITHTHVYINTYIYDDDDDDDDDLLYTNIIASAILESVLSSM